MELKPDYELIFAEQAHLETGRLILRPLTLADAEDMFEYANDKATTKYVFPTHQTLADTRSAIANYFMAAPLGKYAIQWKENGKMIGTIDLRLDKNLNTGEIGYALNKAYWGQGVMPEACLMILSLGFDKLSLLRITAKYDARNKQSGRVMEKIGMVKEGERREARLWKGELINEVEYGISRSQWQRSVM